MTETYPIDKGIPIPPRRRGGPHQAYPFAEMRVGDSFLKPGAASAVEVAASQYGRRHGVQFTTRYVEGGARVWRVR